MSHRPRAHLHIAPIELPTANAFVAKLHRHNKTPTFHRFSIGAFKPDGQLVGVAIAGRPKARAFDPLEVIEVSRLCTDGTPNACSALYAGCARIAKAWGFLRIQSYILASERGDSLLAAGWCRLDAQCGSGKRKWTSKRRPRAEVLAARAGQALLTALFGEVAPSTITAPRQDVPELVGFKQLWGKDL
jgi:hypothetical protein